MTFYSKAEGFWVGLGRPGKVELLVPSYARLTIIRFPVARSKVIGTGKEELERAPTEGFHAYKFLSLTRQKEWKSLKALVFWKGSNEDPTRGTRKDS